MTRSPSLGLDASSPPSLGVLGRPRTWTPAAAANGLSASSMAPLSWFPEITTTWAPVSRRSSTVSQTRPWASGGGADDSKRSPAMSTRSTALPGRSPTISASTRRCSSRRWTPLRTLPTCQSLVWRSFTAVPRRDRRRRQGSTPLGGAGRPGRERELDDEGDGDLGLGDEHRPGLGDRRPGAVDGREEPVLGAVGLGRVEAAGHADGRVGDDAALDLAGRLLGADQDDPQRPPTLGHVQEDLLDRATGPRAGRTCSARRGRGTAAAGPRPRPPSRRTPASP